MAKSKDNRKRRCPECEKKFEANRIDMKFCSRQCRNRCNNRKVRTIKSDTVSVDVILHRNYKILKGLGQATVTRSSLSAAGFNFKYITHFQLTDKGAYLFFLYNYRYYFGKGNAVFISPV